MRAYKHGLKDYFFWNPVPRLCPECRTPFGKPARRVQKAEQLADALGGSVDDGANTARTK